MISATAYIQQYDYDFTVTDRVKSVQNFVKNKSPEQNYPEQLLIEGYSAKDINLNLKSFEAAKQQCILNLDILKEQSLIDNNWDSIVLAKIFNTAKNLLCLISNKIFSKNSVDTYLSDKGTIYITLEKTSNFLTIEIDKSYFTFFGELSSGEVYMYDFLKIEDNKLPTSLENALKKFTDAD